MLAVLLKNKHYKWKNSVKIFSLHLLEFVEGMHTRLYVTLLLYKFLFCFLSRHPTIFSFPHNIWNRKNVGDILHMVWQLVSLGYDDVMELGEIAEILIFPMEFCQHLFFVILQKYWETKLDFLISWRNCNLCLSSCHDLQNIFSWLGIRKESEEILAICWNSWKCPWMVEKCKW